MSTTNAGVSAWQIRAAAGEPLATIRVRNLQTTLGAGAALDAWGRTGRSQPALLSAEVALVASFAEAASADKVAGDTVHYGTLSKAMLKSVAMWDKVDGISGASSKPGRLVDVVEGIWRTLAGHSLAGAAGAAAEAAEAAGAAPVLNLAVTRRLAITAMLPKASLVGEGVSLTASAVVGPARLGGEDTSTTTCSDTPPAVTTLRLHRLRVPTLVGVHPHERTARQAVVADVAIDARAATTLAAAAADDYPRLEALVVRAMEASAFETLEALATHLAQTVLQSAPTAPATPDWTVTVALEKPIAVPFADAPVVEVRMRGVGPS